MNTLKEKNAVLDTEKKNEVLWTLAELLDENRKNIIQMNEADMLSC
jgi:gamma-glutamyl phosphate reductase